jgi:hypothetical protein
MDKRNIRLQKKGYFLLLKKGINILILLVDINMVIYNSRPSCKCVETIKWGA